MGHAMNKSTDTSGVEHHLRTPNTKANIARPIPYMDNLCACFCEDVANTQSSLFRSFLSSSPFVSLSTNKFRSPPNRAHSLTSFISATDQRLFTVTVLRQGRRDILPGAVLRKGRRDILPTACRMEKKQSTFPRSVNSVQIVTLPSKFKTEDINQSRYSINNLVLSQNPFQRFSRLTCSPLPHQETAFPITNRATYR